MAAKELRCPWASSQHSQGPQRGWHWILFPGSCGMAGTVGSHPAAGTGLCVWVPWGPAARGVLFPSVPPSKVFLSPQNNSVSPSESLRASEKHRSSTDYSIDSKKRKAEEKDSMSRYVSDRDEDALGQDLGGESGIWVMFSRHGMGELGHRTMESFRLEKPFETMESNHPPALPRPP